LYNDKNFWWNAKNHYGDLGVQHNGMEYDLVHMTTIPLAIQPLQFFPLGAYVVRACIV
jgi:hypothetical protein